MEKTAVTTLDLNFKGHKESIASYMIPHSSGVVLVESGPSSTLPAMMRGLAAHGLTAKDVTHVLVTHIHMDHAGASGWFAMQGAQILVHPVGAPHLIDPSRLLQSASRIYGDEMESLFGDVLPVPEDQVQVVEDGQEVEIGGLRFLPLSTPGHAEHHHAYIYEDICFSGDIGGIRVPGQRYLRLPTPPPELVIERWQDSVNKLRRAKFAKIAPTHFGIYDDPQWHLDEVERELVETTRWLTNCMSLEPDAGHFRDDYAEWVRAEGHARGISDETMDAYDTTNPPNMSADGLRRYWMKVRQAH